MRYNRREKTGGQQSQVSLSALKAAEPSTMPFAQRLTCTIDDACEVTGLKPRYSQKPGSSWQRFDSVLEFRHVLQLVLRGAGERRVVRIPVVIRCACGW